MIILPRRSFLLGLGALIAAPAIVHAENIMHVRARVLPMRGPALELIGFTDICGDDGLGEIIDTFGKADLAEIARKILAADIVYVR
jgi:hypothetical protein